ncbi:hypothetical protein ACR6C2_40195 [Streptomyces sp. INA 01156]
MLSRYTLSLLTTQQFQRAATTVCALESMRRADPATYGEEPFSIGLWVGETTTANSYEKARRAFDDARQAAAPDDVFILDRCPWCGTRILPPTSRPTSTTTECARAPTPSPSSVRGTRASSTTSCPSPSWTSTCTTSRPPSCSAPSTSSPDLPGNRAPGGSSSRHRPLAAVPRHPGRTPPAHRPARHHRGPVRGRRPRTVHRAGRNRPKVVASTATIRRSGEQVRALYGGDVQLFPPAGLDARHSYFAEPDTSRPGRRYIGVMAQGHTAGRASVATAAALLQGAWQLPEEHRDAYWTLVAYHHSLRELGRTVTAAADDIPAQLAGLDSGAGYVRCRTPRWRN